MRGWGGDSVEMGRRGQVGNELALALLGCVREPGGGDPGCLASLCGVTTWEPAAGRLWRRLLEELGVDLRVCPPQPLSRGAGGGGQGSPEGRRKSSQRREEENWGGGGCWRRAAGRSQHRGTGGRTPLGAGGRGRAPGKTVV